MYKLEPIIGRAMNGTTDYNRILSASIDVESSDSVCLSAGLDESAPAAPIGAIAPFERSGALGNVDILRRSSYSPFDHRALNYNPRAAVLPGGMVVKSFSGSSFVPDNRGQRGIISGFSLDSRRRLRVRLMSVDWSAIDALWVTLTYHNQWSDNPDDWKAQLDAFIKRIERKFIHYVGLVWRLEFQKRGAPHFHILMVFQKNLAPKDKGFELWAGSVWADIAGENDDFLMVKHGVKAINVHKSRGLGVLLGYMVNEMGKCKQSYRMNEKTGEPLPTGRVWGMRGNIPMLRIADIEFATEEDFEKFIQKVNKIGSDVGSAYWSSITTNWSGFVLMGDGFDMLMLLKGLNFTIREPDDDKINI